MPPEDSRHNTAEMKQLLEYISRHNDDLLKTRDDKYMLTRIPIQQNN